MFLPANISRLTVWLLLILALRCTIRASALPAPRTCSKQISALKMPNCVDKDELLEHFGRFMLSIMNQEVDPCEDFYQYACGNFHKTEMLSEAARNKTVVLAMQMKLDEELEIFLKNFTAAELKLDAAESKAKLFHKSCLEKRNEISGGHKLIENLDEFRHELQPKANETYDWININFMSEHGVYPLLPLTVGLGHLNIARRYELSLSAPQKVLGQHDVETLVSKLKVEKEVKDEFATRFAKMLKFEKSLLACAKKRNETERLTLGEFLEQHKDDAVNWTRYFEVAFNGSQKDEWFVSNDIDEVRDLAKVLDKTELTTLRDYVKWCMLINFYEKWTVSEGASNSTEHACLAQTSDYFGAALMPWFAQHFFDSERNADVLMLAKTIKQTFYAQLDAYEWLDDETRSAAKTKLRAMDVYTDYHDGVLQRQATLQKYKSLLMSEDYFGNLLRLEAEKASELKRLVHQPLTKPETPFALVNSFYHPVLNAANIFVAHSQLPAYHIHLPAVFKYAGIGAVIGHEIGHGFDTYCNRFNHMGEEQNWWSAASLRNFRERHRCVEAQFSKFVMDDFIANGTYTSGEDLADNLGLRMTYKSYMQNFGSKDGNEHSIPGMNFTNKQLFFVQFAQRFCNSKNFTPDIEELKNDVHSYDEFRLRGSLMNMEEFSETFQCELGSIMNPVKKCIVW